MIGPHRHIQTSAGTGNVTPVSSSETVHSRRCASVSCDARGRDDLRVATLFAETVGAEVLPADHARVGGRPQRRQRTHVGALEERFRQLRHGRDQWRQVAGQFGADPPGCAAAAMVLVPCKRRCSS